MNKAISRFSLGASAHELVRRLPALELDLAERAGSHPHLPLESLAHIFHVAKAAFFRHCAAGERGGGQQVPGVGELPPPDLAVRRAADGLLPARIQRKPRHGAGANLRGRRALLRHSRSKSSS